MNDTDARNALAEAIQQHHRVASVAYGHIQALLQDADEALALTDVGHPPDVEGDLSAYDRHQIRQWEQDADVAERRAPAKLKRLARSLRQVAERIENDIGSASISGSTFSG